MKNRRNEKVTSKIRKEVRELSYISVLSLLYYCLQEDNFGIGSKSSIIALTTINPSSKSFV